MSNFFNKSDLTRQDADKIVSETLNNCDDGELYLEESKSESILLDDNKIKAQTIVLTWDLVLGLFQTRLLLIRIQMKYQKIR